jgi:hypothetical protein
MVLASLLVIGQAFQSVGLSTAEAKEAKRVQKRERGEREGVREKPNRRPPRKTSAGGIP